MSSSRWMNRSPRLRSISGARGYLVWNGAFEGRKMIGNIDSTLFEHLFYSLCTRAGIT